MFVRCTVWGLALPRSEGGKNLLREKDGEVGDASERIRMKQNWRGWGHSRGRSGVELEEAESWREVEAIFSKTNKLCVHMWQLFSAGVTQNVLKQD